MVGVAKWLTHRIVIPTYVGSIPITHPILPRRQTRSQFSDGLSFRSLLCISIKKFLQKKYVGENASADEVASEIGCAVSTVLKHLKKYGILVREGG